MQRESLHTKRIIGLDVLRAVAVILVLFRHSYYDTNLLYRAGWLGVDLFFVLSGFLIASILFKEYLKKGSISIGKFLFRRAFKIFPPFYFFLAIYLLSSYLFIHKVYPLKDIYAELFYVQSYYHHLLQHSWSLAVEEQFYILMACFIPLAIYFNLLGRRVFCLIIFALLLILCFYLRYRITLVYPHDIEVLFFKTHLRADGLVVGVLAAYLVHFFEMDTFFYRFKKMLFPLAAFLIVPGFIFDGAFYVMNTIGLSMVNIGFGLLVLLIYFEKSTALIHSKQVYATSIMAYIGLHSYSIYLWHLYAKEFLIAQLNITVFWQTIIYFVLAFVLGIFFSYIIERPILLLREKWVGRSV